MSKQLTGDEDFRELSAAELVAYLNAEDDEDRRPARSVDSDDRAALGDERIVNPPADASWVSSRNIVPFRRPDGHAGMDWWNALTQREREDWLRVADTAIPAEAWAAFKRRRAARR